MASGVGSWSTTAADNATADSDINWAEGQAPSTVNNSSRAEMAAIATLERDGGWISFTQYPFTYASGTTGTIAGDVTGANLYPAGRRVRAVGSSTGTIYGRISASSYGAPNTTLTFVWDSGSLSNETITLSVARLSARAAAVGQIPGTTTSDAAVAGSVGEYISSSIDTGSAVGLTSAANANVAGVTLSAGDWDVSAVLNFRGSSATTITYLSGGVSTTSATLDSTQGRRTDIYHAGESPFGSVSNLGLWVIPTRFSFSAATSVYLVAQAVFGGSTTGAFGHISGRRVR